jgi:hypothetical protein
MTGSVKSRPNHYETLGVRTTASANEISEAFGRKMGLGQPDPLGRVTDLCVAYQTLRDPDKRRDYDRLLGLKRETKPLPLQATVRVTQQRWTPFMASQESNFAKEPPSAPEPHVAAEPPVDRRLAAIAESVRELAKPPAPDASPGSPAMQARRPAQRPQIDVDELVEQIRATGRAEKQRLQEEHASFDWKRPALILGGLVAGAGLFGAVAGLSLKGDEAPAQAEPAKPGTHHVAVHQPALAAPTSAPIVFHADATARRHVRETVRRTARTISRQRQAAQFDQDMAETLAAPSPATASQPAAPAVDDTAAPAKPVDAALPLPRAIVARTIDRIGYACGAVVSASAVGSGVYRVNCTSGRSYQATPVGGRYRFRRVGG